MHARAAWTGSAVALLLGILVEFCKSASHGPILSLKRTQHNNNFLAASPLGQKLPASHFHAEQLSDHAFRTTIRNQNWREYSIGERSRPLVPLRGGESSANKSPSPTPVKVTPKRAKRKLRCALFAWESLHTVVEGGVAPHVTELAAGLERRGHEVHLFVRAAPGQEPYARIHGVHLHRIPYGRHKDIVKDCDAMCEQFFWLCNWLEGYMGQKVFDVYHAHDWLAAKVVTEVKRRFGARKAIMTMHSTEWGRCGKKWARWACEGQSGAIRDIEHAACVSADSVICVSGVLAEEVQMLYEVPKNKCVTIYNGIHVQQYDEVLVDPGHVKGSLGMPWYRPLVLFVGRLALQKGPDLLLEAVPDVVRNSSAVGLSLPPKFVFVGEGHLLPELRQKAEALGVGGDVVFAGSKRGRELRALQKAADCIVVPSRSEPFGIVVLEGWAAGKPVLATTHGGPVEFLRHQEDGLLMEPDPNSIAVSVLSLLSNWTRLATMGENGHRRCTEEFSWDTIARQTEEAYYRTLTA